MAKDKREEVIRRVRGTGEEQAASLLGRDVKCGEVLMEHTMVEGGCRVAGISRKEDNERKSDSDVC